MSKFKIGDRVVVIQSDDTDPHVGSTGTILDNSGCPYIHFDDHRWTKIKEWKGRYAMSEDSLELIVSDEQTLAFWNLQLQFMNMTPHQLYSLFFIYNGSGLYKDNSYSQKMRDTIMKGFSYWTEDDRNCVATHLALQMSGIEE